MTARQSKPSVVDLLPLAVAGAATALLMLPTMILPLHPDQALFAVVGRTVASGGFPYRDAWDFKLPGLYLLYAVAIHGPFDVAHNVRLFALVWTAVSAVLVAELGRRWWNWRGGLLAALIYAVVCSTDIPFWQSAQPDSLAVLPLLLSLLLYEISHARPAYLIAAGLALGIAFQLRATIAFLAPLYPLVELIQAQYSPRFRIWLQRMLWLSCGFALLQIAVLGYLLAGGAFGEFLTTMQYAAGYTRTGGPWNPSSGPTLPAYWGALRQAFWNWADPRLVLVFPALAAGIVGGTIGNRRALQVLLFVAVCYAGVAVQLKFFWYHYEYMVPFLALLGGFGWDSLVRAAARYRPPAIGLIGVGAVAAILLLGSTEIWDNGMASWRSYVSYYRHPSEWRQSSPSISGLRDEELVANYVQERTRPGDRMYVWGFDPALYLLADRSLGSRFVLSYPLMSGWSPARWQPEFVDELRANKPAYIVLHPDQPESWIVGQDLDAIDYINRFPAFQQLLATDYERETTLAGRILYRRRAP